jgi:hypothetical protein
MYITGTSLGKESIPRKAHVVMHLLSKNLVSTSQAPASEMKAFPERLTFVMHLLSKNLVLISQAPVWDKKSMSGATVPNAFPGTNLL